MGEAAVKVAPRRRLHQRRHRRVPLPGRRVLLPRDEHPPPGRALGHRGDHRARPRRVADPGRRRASRSRSPRTSVARARGHAIEVPHQRRGPGGGGFLPSPGPITAAAWRPTGFGVRFDGGYEAGDDGRSTTTTSSASSSCGAGPRRRPIARTIRALEEIEVDGVATTIPADLAHPAPPRLRGRRALDEVGRGGRSTSSGSASAARRVGRRRRPTTSRRRWSSARDHRRGQRQALRREACGCPTRRRRRPRAAAAAGPKPTGRVRPDGGGARQRRRSPRRCRARSSRCSSRSASGRGRPGRASCSRR